MRAWQDPIGTIRDICPGDPTLSYHPDIAKLYDTDVPDGAVNGATLVEGVWTNPPPPAQPTPEELAATAQAAAEASRLASIPQTVSMCQARLVLQATGKYAEVNSAISSMTGPNGDNARIEWEFRTEVNRNQLLVTSIGKLLKLSESEIDDLFIAAAKL